MQLICLHIVINHLIHNPTTKALWIDTEGEFSGEKALAVLETKQSDLVRSSPFLFTSTPLLSLTQDFGSQDTTSVLDRLVIQRMFDLPPFSELVSKLHLDLAEPAPEDDNQQQQQGGPQKHRSQGFSLLVVDSITSLYENFIATAELEGECSLFQPPRRSDLLFSLDPLFSQAEHPSYRTSTISQPCPNPTLSSPSYVGLQSHLNCRRVSSVSHTPPLFLFLPPPSFSSAHQPLHPHLKESQ